jgi:hypothetical protein
MIIQKYKPGKDIHSFDNKNRYDQFCSCGEIIIKGYYKYGRYIGYQESYANSGVKYTI